MQFDQYVARVNTKLDHHLTAQGSLTEAMRYSVLAGGKRFRPILTYCVTDMFGVSLERADSSSCAVEFIHAYSLIHDDLPAMDDDDIRHNQPSCHKHFDEAQAILAGDGLQALAFEVLVNDSLLDSQIKIELLSMLTHAAFEMAEGQSIDLSIVDKAVDIELLESMHRKKTGALLSCAVDLGAVVAKCSKQDRTLLKIFSQAIGLAYQIQDDVLDIEVPVGVLGKRQYSDSEKNKPTYPAIIGLQRSKEAYQALYLQAKDCLCDLSVDAQVLQKLIEKLEIRVF
jgi:farnesyl diphosphate synthase/geranylgeranyl diphosphate synthase type II